MESGKKAKKQRVGDYVIECRDTSEGEKCLVKWKNLKHESSTWEMKENVEKGLLDKFEDQVVKKVKGEETTKGAKGSLQCGDKVCDLMAVDTKKHPSLGFKFQASWFKRLDNTTPQPSLVYSEELRLYDPQALIDFYQKRVHFSVVDKHQLKIDKEKKKLMQQNKLKEKNKPKEVITINSQNNSPSREEQPDPKPQSPLPLTAEQLITEIQDDDHFQRACLSSPRLALVDFYTKWCKPCQVVTPLLQEVAVEQQLPLFLVQIDSDDNVDTYERYNILNPPTVILLKDTKEQARFVGKKTKQEILEFIKPHLD